MMPACMHVHSICMCVCVCVYVAGCMYVYIMLQSSITSLVAESGIFCSCTIVYTSSSKSHYSVYICG